MYNLTEYVQKEGYKSPTHEQIKQIQQTEEYLKKHKIHELFNVSIFPYSLEEMLSRLIETKPENTKQGMAEILKQIKNKTTYFKKQDFEQMFDSYNFFEEKADNKIPFNYLLQGLRRITVNYEREEFLEKYPKFKLDKMIGKAEFVNVMEQEYKEVTKFEF